MIYVIVYVHEFIYNCVVMVIIAELTDLEVGFRQV